MVYTADFKTHKDDNQPYSLKSEGLHGYADPDGYVKNNCFYLVRRFSRQLLEMPDVDKFSMTCTLCYVPPVEFGPSKSVVWTIGFGYDSVRRCGQQIRFSYTPSEHRINIDYCTIDKTSVSEVSTIEINDITMSADGNELELCVNNDILCGEICGIRFSFRIQESCGVVALSKECETSAIGFSGIVVKSECPKKENVYNHTFRIPKTDGGCMDYFLDIAVDKYTQNNDIYEISYSLHGGANEKDSKFAAYDCWIADFDEFKSLYFCIGEAKYYIDNDTLVFTCNEKPKFKKRVNGQDTPYSGRYFTSRYDADGNISVGYGMRYSLSAGNLASERVFLFDRNAVMLYNGKSISDNFIINIITSKDKMIAKNIPKDIPKYAEALFFAENNHFFYTDEKIEFTAELYKKVDEKYLRVYAYLTDAYFDKITALEIKKLDSNSQNPLLEYGYTKTNYTVCVENVLPQGVYHIAIVCKYGDRKEFKHLSAFEVIDSNESISPQESSGLPTIYCGDAFLTEYSTNDLWVARPDYNITHYINGSLYVPRMSEDMQAWRLIHLYKRKLFSWMTYRTFTSRDETYADYPGTIKNADYLYVTFPGNEDCVQNNRCYVWKYSNFESDIAKQILKDFINDYPQYREYFENWFTIPGEILDKWVHYHNAKIKPLFTEQWNNIQQTNPNVKRYAYGPYPAYTSRHSSGYNTKWYGIDIASMKDVYNGFMKFEDYPYIGGYETHICAWTLATIKMMAKDLCIAPELYDSFGIDCPDPHVMYAKPPKGEIYAPPYQTVTQLYEYLYNTAIFDDGKFRYWNDNFINMYDHKSYEPEKRYSDLLKAWGFYLKNPPEKPIASVGYIADFNAKDDVRNPDIYPDCIYNSSLTAMTIVHKVCSESGYPGGFVTDFNSVMKLTKDDMRVLVIPSLYDVDDKVKSHIRQLHKDGVLLIATGNVDGLEDIFGVKPDEHKEFVTTISYKNETENVYPYNCSFRYAPVNPSHADVTIANSQTAVIIEGDRAMLINSSLGHLGIETLLQLSQTCRKNISKLIYNSCRDFLSRTFNADVTVISEKVGAKAVMSKTGDLLVILTEYSTSSDFCEKNALVKFSGIDVCNISYIDYDDHPVDLNILRCNGAIEGFNVTIRSRETLIFKCSVKK